MIRNLRLSLRVLAAHRVRTTLAIAGTAIGVAGVVVLTALGEGARSDVVQQFERLGRNLLVVTTSPVTRRAGRAVQGDGRWTEMRVADAIAIRHGSRAVVRTAPAQNRDMTAKFGRISSRVTVVGTTSDWLSIRRFAIEEGRFFTDAENVRRVRFAVLGAETRRSLFPDSIDPIGRMVRIDRVPFEVVGVLAPQGVSIDGSGTEDDRIIVPLETALRRLFNIDGIGMIYIEASSPSAMKHAEEDAAGILRARHDSPADRDPFLIRNQQALIDAELATRRPFQRLISGLGFLSLIVGGAGILSVMLLSVRERRSEIGLRIAVGARRPDIAAQFVAESILLAAGGGLIGILLGAGAAAVLSAISTREIAFSGATVAVAVLSAVLIGTGAGVLPAWRAASLDPIDALRAE